MDPRTEEILRYHHRTKHHQTHYAAGPPGLDWSAQPDPFRSYSGAPRHAWPLAADSLATPYRDLRRAGAVSPRPVTGDNLGILFEISLGLSAVKSAGDASWALRCNPSSGNLHPTEGYLACPTLPGLESGVYHYTPGEHALERRAAPGALWDGAFPADGVLVGLASIHWREAWKYGERAYRYCQHDVGHALAAIRYAASALGWEAEVLEAWSDSDISALLGLDREESVEGAEKECPDLVLWVGPAPARPGPATLVKALHDASWSGRANRLSSRHVEWMAVEEAERAAGKPRTKPGRPHTPCEMSPLPVPRMALPAALLFRQRRSAVAYDGATSMPSAVFFAVLDALLPRPGLPPFDALPWAPRLHLVLFVHRVEGLPPGLYLLPRSAEGDDVLKAAVGPGWEWADVADCPPHLRLRRLLSEDVTRAARIICCHQEIAADSAFSLGMLAQFQDALEEGPWVYRQLFWEAGVIGQALYLEAEAWGFRGTGIGCYFDDEVHRLLGLPDDTIQDLYHFTVGAPLEDSRIATFPPYGKIVKSEKNRTPAAN